MVAFMEIYGYSSQLHCQLWKCSQWAIKVGRHKRWCLVTHEEKTGLNRAYKGKSQPELFAGLLLLLGKSQHKQVVREENKYYNPNGVGCYQPQPS